MYMDKLIKKFEEAVDNYIFDTYGILKKLPKDCAEITKQIAVDFNKYLQHNWINIWGGNNYVPRYSILVKEEHHISIEEVFAKFIEEEYGK